MTSKAILNLVIVGIVLIGYPGAGFSLDARELILLNKLLHDKVLTMYERATLSTCKYELKQGKVSCIESPRVKEYESVTKYYSKTEKNGKRELKNVRIILKPKSEQGLGMLNYGYQRDDKDDENWIYFSSLGKVRRITSSDKNRNEPQSGSIFGSEYSSEDMTSTPIDDYTHKIIKTIKLDDRETCVIEIIPSADRLRKSNYSKSILWMDMERKTITKMLKYNLQGQEFKLFTFTDWNKIDDIWMPERQSVINLLSKRKTTIDIVQRKLNIVIDNESYFSQRILLDGVFRKSFFESIKKAM
jgi:hypothetical protein